MKGFKRFFSGVCVLAMILAMCAFSASSAETASFAGGDGTAQDPYRIETAEQLDAVRNDLAAHYILTKDIDLSGDTWTPLGELELESMDGETPVKEKGFSGVFDGDGHVITGAHMSGSMAVGLFGVVAGGTVKDVTLESASVSGNCMAAAAVGYAWKATLDNVDLNGGTVNGVVVAGAAPNMVAGIVGAGMDSTLVRCDALGVRLFVEALPNAAALTENVHDIGLVGGGLENTNLADCSANDGGIVIDGSYCFGVGGLSGCAMSAETVESCSVTNVSIAMGDNAYLVGGLLGYSGRDGGEATAISNCAANEVTINLGASAQRVGGLVGGGFYVEAYAAYFPNPTSFDLTVCQTSGTITAPYGSAMGALAGCVYASAADENLKSSLTINEHKAPLMGEDAALKALEGEYKPLFSGGILDSRFDAYWHDYCAAVMGEENAEATAAMLKASIGGSVYGQAAVEAYASEPESARFCCGFINGLDEITFSQNTISGVDSEGKQLFSHEYAYIGSLSLGAEEGVMGFDGLLYQSADADSGEFTYFFILPDTHETTYHIEFRYGGDLDALKRYASGEYAYWLAAGQRTDATELDNEQVIALFCLENMDYSAQRTPASLAQLSELIGAWDCDVSAYPEFAAYGITGLYFEIDGAGMGRTYAEMNGSGQYTETDSYLAYAYHGGPASQYGVYAAHNPAGGETTPSHYTLKTVDGETIVTFETLDGEQISYTKR